MYLYSIRAYSTTPLRQPEVKPSDFFLQLTALNLRLNEARKRAARAHLIPVKARSLTSALHDMPVQQAKGILQGLVIRVIVWDKSTGKPVEVQV